MRGIRGWVLRTTPSSQDSRDYPETDRINAVDSPEKLRKPLEFEN